MATLKDITDENFEKEVLNNSKYTSVTFSALSWCQPCKILHGNLLEIVKTDLANQVDFCSADIESGVPNEAIKASIRGVPTTHIYFNKKIIGTKVGSVSKQQFEQFVLDTIKSNK